MVFVIGEILVDEFPDYSRIGGASFNFAVHLHRFGVPVRFVSRVGNDRAGKNILDFVSSTGLPAEGIQIDPEYPTGKVKVTLDSAGVPEFNILPEAAYDRVDIPEAPDYGKMDMIYYGTLIQRTEAAHHRILTFLENRAPGVRTFCDINLRKDCYNNTTVRTSVENADILKLSVDETAEIAGCLKLPENPADAAERLRTSFGVDILILTRGAEGSELFEEDTHARVTPPPLSTVVDTVGAGDAFAAAAAYGVLRGSAPRKILETASTFAAAICGVEGAVPETSDIYTRFLAEYE